MAQYKYSFKKGDTIGDSFLRYVCEDKRGNGRYVVTYCELCGAFTSKRLSDIISGKVKSCGCYYRRLVEDGKLKLYSLNARKEKPFIQKGGHHYKEGLCLYLRKDIIKKVDLEKIVFEIVEFIRNDYDAVEG